VTGWRPKLGATVAGRDTVFCVWAPDASTISVVIENRGDFPMIQSRDGYCSTTVTGCGPGDFYRYKIEGRGLFPDPASRYQPQGVHGPSQVVDPSLFQWTDQSWKGIAREDLILYELHVGTFTPGGTFQSAMEKLAELRDLGVTAVELMPVADFAGNRNWGYDGVALFAPSRRYGTPGNLQRFVDTAHGLGLAVFLDVVYNHFGPDGACHSLFSRNYFSKKHRSPWGDGINFDGPDSGPVRDFFIENALRWIHEYHFDGLRLDATHAIVDESPQHILAAISSSVRASMADTGKHTHVIAEDVGNSPHMLKPESQRGWGLDAVWSDDFHHQLRRALAGDSDGYFADFDGTARSIAETARKGWFYSGQYAPYFGRKRGGDPAGLEYSRFVFYIQNHDQIGNRAFGDRLHHKMDLSAYRAASVLLLMLPEIPLLFMGQEWAAATPFQYFTDHHRDLGRMVTEGRRREFKKFAAFADAATRESIPDPQAEATFEASRLRWEEKDRQPHAGVLRLYKALLAVRNSEPALRSRGCSGGLCIDAPDDGALIVKRAAPDSQAFLAVIRLKGEGIVRFSAHAAGAAADDRWIPVLDTEDGFFAPDSKPPGIDLSASTVSFMRPGAILFANDSKDRHRRGN
jgi:maltooligosyltrehalose trehalohydrolase